MLTMRLAVAGLSLIAVAVSAPAFAQDDNGISWRVVDRFRFFASEDPGGQSPPQELGYSDLLMAPVFEAQRASGGGANWVAEQWTAFAETARDATFAAAGIETPDDSASGQAIRDAHDTARQAPRYFWWDRRTDTYDRTYLTPHRYWIAATANASEETCAWRVQTADGRNQIELNAPCARALLPIAADWTSVEGQAGVHRARVEAVSPSGVVSRVDVAIEDRLIVGIGDSVAAGEGNPDIAADWRGLGEPDVLAELLHTGGDSGAGWFMTRAAARNVAGAVWLDEQCHRSLNSWQARAAMAVAAENPHIAVTFVSFACGGASTYDGMLYPQDSPPGGERYVFAGDERVRSRGAGPSAADASLVVNDGVAQRLGQIDAIARLLCERTAPVAVTLYRDVERDSDWRASSYEGAQCEHPVRSISTLLVTLGGNDVGFAEAIIWSIVPQNGGNWIEGLIYRLANNGMEGRKCPRRIAYDPGCNEAADRTAYTWTEGAAQGDCRTGPDGLPVHVEQRRPTGLYLTTCFLPVALHDARAAIGRLGVSDNDQIWAAYPSAFWRGPERREEMDAAQRDASGPNDYLISRPNYSWLCGRDETLPERVITNGEEESRALLALYGGADSAGRLPGAGWVLNQFTAPDLGFRIMRWETNETAQYLYRPLVARLQREFGERLVDNYLGDARSPDVENDWRGWCASSNESPAAEGLFPRMRNIDGRVRWTGNYRPWDWEPYRRVPRLFRSPSDSALTQFPGPDFRNEISLGVMTNKFADSVAGMLHPNAEAHAIIANEAMTRMPAR